ncbi:hypothetical protein BZA05DRAFT_338284, partial [Tricharina praecox]|uniref:uncharacterized protein n=1 Tax=Tricharina praecox TaxID=43433 RepID=UPI002220AB2A
LDDGDTVVLMVFLSNAKHLTNFSGDKKVWPVHMTVGNLSFTIRMAPGQPGILLITLLSLPVKMREVPTGQYNEQKEHNRMMQQHVLRHIQELLIDADRRTFYAQCAECYFGHYVASLDGWIADYPEHRDLYNISNGFCHWCECPRGEICDYLVNPHGRRDRTIERALNDINTLEAREVSRTTTSTRVPTYYGFATA